MMKSLLLVPLALAAMTGLAAAAPPGSYRQSCDNIRQRGPFLTAECDTRDGDSVRTSLDLRGCRGGIRNDDGRLVCNRDFGDDDFRPRRPRFDEGDRGPDGPRRFEDRPPPPQPPHGGFRFRNDDNDR